MSVFFHRQLQFSVQQGKGRDHPYSYNIHPLTIIQAHIWSYACEMSVWRNHGACNYQTVTRWHLTILWEKAFHWMLIALLTTSLNWPNDRVVPWKHMCIVLLTVYFCHVTYAHWAAQKMKFFIKDFFSKCDQICRKFVVLHSIE